MSKPTTDDLMAAAQYRDTLLDRADGHASGVYPWWHGWVIVEAYLAGLKAGRAERPAAGRGCPCHWIAPCRPRCACVAPASSLACLRCCRYGSEEQRRARAEIIAAQIAGVEPPPS